jgi:hypothetical protein
MQTQRRLGRAAARPVLVAIPVRDEAEEIGPCRSRWPRSSTRRAFDGVILCLNNCHDGTAEAVRAIARNLPYQVYTIEVTLLDGFACAGRARRLAMERAADLAGSDSVLFTTDADARVGPNCIAANLAALAAGVGCSRGSRGDRAQGAELIPAHALATPCQDWPRKTESAVDHSQRRKRLRKIIAREMASRHVVLLGQEPEIIANGKDTFELCDRCFAPSLQVEAVRHPAGANEKSSLRIGPARAGSPYETALGQLALHCARTRAQLLDRPPRLRQ